MARSPAPGPDDRRPLRLGRDRPALPRVPRPGVGRSPARRPAALRAPLPGGRPGRPRLDHDPPEARGVPARLRPLRSPEGGPLRRGQGPRAAPRPRHRPQPAQGPGRRHECPRLPRAAGGARPLRPVPLELRRRRAAAERVAEPQGGPGPHAGVGRAQQGAPAARLHVRGLDDLLRVHAGRRAGQRPRRRLLPPPRGGPAPRATAARRGRRADRHEPEGEDHEQRA